MEDTVYVICEYCDSRVVLDSSTIPNLITEDRRSCQV